MLGFPARLPIGDEEREWVDEGFRRLERLIGRRRMLEAKVVLPTAEHFPDPYDKTPETAEFLFERVCSYMGVDRKLVEIEIFPDETEELCHLLPYWKENSAGCAGLYVHKQSDRANEERTPTEENRLMVAIRSTQLQDPLSLVATFGHELGHVILLGGKLIDPNMSDHEPLTDLLTVFLGLGIFTANSSGRFKQFQEDRRHGWSMQRLGYLPEQAYGYALARFARERGEDKPRWVKHLSTNVRTYFKRSRIWMANNMTPIGSPRPIG